VKIVNNSSGVELLWRRNDTLYFDLLGVHDPILRSLVAKAPRGNRAVGIEADQYIPVPEFHKLMEECLQDNSKAGARDRTMLALA
jgi:hypothetical protein